MSRWGLPTLVLALTSMAAATHGQELASGIRTLTQSVGLPGIDLGLRANDAPVDPNSRILWRYDADSNSVSAARGELLHLSGSVVVKFRSGTGQSSVLSAMSEVGAATISRPSYADFEIMQIAPDADPESVAAELRSRPDVEYAQPRYLNHPMARPNDPLYAQQWNFPAIDMERAWDIQPAAGSEITVAVLDSGAAFRTANIRYNANRTFRLTPTGPLFPALGPVDVPFAVAPELGDAKFVAPRDFIWEDTLPFDLDGHGTHVSGTIGQLTNNGVGVAGMAYGVRLMPVKVIAGQWDFNFGAPFVGTDDVIARGIRYAAENGADIINMSIGREAGGPATVVDAAIRYAVSEHGVFVAVASGNSADQGNAPNRVAESAPAIPGMVAVAAVSRSLSRAYYSTTNTYVEIAAPGGDQRLHGTAGGVLQQTLAPDQLHTYLSGPAGYRAPRGDAFTYQFYQGTSMATPHVAAFAAMLMQQGITNPVAIEAAMKRFALDLGTPGNDNEYGMGLIQPRTTLRGLGLAR